MLTSDPNGKNPIAGYSEIAANLPSNPTTCQSLTSRYTKAVVEFIHSKKDQPFLAYVAHNQPHLGLFVSDTFKGKSRRGLLGDVMAEIDDSVGQIIKALEDAGIAKNTLVIFSSDNGPWILFQNAKSGKYGEARMHVGYALPFRDGKGSNWEGGHRVPFIVRWPGKIAAGSTSDQTVCLTDVMATCAAMTGATLPVNAAEDSFNLLPELLGKTNGARVRPYTLHQTSTLALALRRGDWKYLDHRGSGGNNYERGELNTFAQPDAAPEAPGQLYNLKIDPGETTNLYFKHPELVRELRALLDSSKVAGRSAPPRSMPPP